MAVRYISLVRTRIPGCTSDSGGVGCALAARNGATKSSKDKTYQVPAEYRSEATCERVAQDVGFPYIHLLHTYVRF